MAEAKVIVSVGLERLNKDLADTVADGFEPHGDLLVNGVEFTFVVRKGFTSGGGAEAPTVDTLSGASAVGKSVMKAADAAAAKTLLGIA